MRTIFDVRLAREERRVIQPEQRPKLAQHRQRAINEILIRARKIRVDHPMQIALSRRE